MNATPEWVDQYRPISPADVRIGDVIGNKGPSWLRTVEVEEINGPQTHRNQRQWTFYGKSEEGKPVCPTFDEGDEIRLYFRSDT
ncbi:hypothetical protein [Mycolicibacterium pulveris]|uniref:hypothetical protein n=1 Tax=Mycolicibacterium pulveris TaxID=36813 RepID=UPI003CF3A56B